MARPKTTSGYPQVFFDIIMQVSSSDKPFVIELENSGAAMAQRFRFYDFLRACRKSNDPRDIETGRMGAAIVMQIKDNFLTLSARDHTLEAHELEDSLRNWGGSVSSAMGGDSREDEPVKLTIQPFHVKVDPNLHEELPSHDKVIEDYLKEGE